MKRQNESLYKSKNLVEFELSNSIFSSHQNKCLFQISAMNAPNGPEKHEKLFSIAGNTVVATHIASLARIRTIIKAFSKMFATSK